MITYHENCSALYWFLMISWYLDIVGTQHVESIFMVPICQLKWRCHTGQLIWRGRETWFHLPFPLHNWLAHATPDVNSWRIQRFDSKVVPCLEFCCLVCIKDVHTRVYILVTTASQTEIWLIYIFFHKGKDRIRKKAPSHTSCFTSSFMKSCKLLFSDYFINISKCSILLLHSSSSQGQKVKHI